MFSSCLSLQVLHPKNPFAPTLHFNYRYFETDAPKGKLHYALLFSSALCINLAVLISSLFSHCKCDLIRKFFFIL